MACNCHAPCHTHIWVSVWNKWGKYRGLQDRGFDSRAMYVHISTFHCFSETTHYLGRRYVGDVTVSIHDLCSVKFDALNRAEQGHITYVCGRLFSRRQHLQGHYTPPLNLTPLASSLPTAFGHMFATSGIRPRRGWSWDTTSGSTAPGS
ncbi:hypothetical protein BT67DRAFT_115874 [Trichocladium antarcticum]|uniref:Uncharacterized protein n=1 Tax=Trichocladium antarcticum TaxID=1450529 RepID=A0AAN6ZGJ6_9PEZI|nr:hypothetical protein BT67DRAFT_115874 [Trichocladium antarcticum]